MSKLASVGYFITINRGLKTLLTEKINLEIQSIYDGVVYHYTTMNTLMSIVENQCLWLSKSDFLNDSSEIQYVLRLVDSVGLDLHQNSMSDMDSGNAMNARNFLLEQLEYESAKIYILSLTETNDLISLWYNYAQQEGCNIGLDMKSLDESLHDMVDGNNTFAMHGSVVYRRSEQEQMVRREFDKFIQQLGRLPEPVQTDYQHRIWQDFRMRFFTYGVFFKDECFEPENEYRVAIVTYNDNSVLFRNSRGAIIPYIKLPLAKPFRSVMIGPRNKQDIVESGLQYYLRVQGLSNVETQVSSIPLRF